MPARLAATIVLALGRLACGAPGPVAALRSGEVRFEGTCDASGAVPLSASSFAVADDEDNVLRVYDAERGGGPLYAGDISLGLGLEDPRLRGFRGRWITLPH